MKLAKKEAKPAAAKETKAKKKPAAAPKKEAAPKVRVAI